MEFVVIEKKDWHELQEKISQIEQHLINLNSKTTSNIKQLWIPLNDFLKASTISRASWYREYQHRIKHRNDGIKIWVHWPSYENYLEEKAINKKAA